MKAWIKGRVYSQLQCNITRKTICIFILLFQNFSECHIQKHAYIYLKKTCILFLYRVFFDFTVLRSLDSTYWIGILSSSKRFCRPTHSEK